MGKVEKELLPANPWDYYHRNPSLKRVMDSFHSTLFCPQEPGLFSWIYDAITMAFRVSNRCRNLRHFPASDLATASDAAEGTDWSFR